MEIDFENIMLLGDNPCSFIDALTDCTSDQKLRFLKNLFLMMDDHSTTKNSELRSSIDLKYSFNKVGIKFPLKSKLKYTDLIVGSQVTTAKGKIIKSNPKITKNNVDDFVDRIDFDDDIDQASVMRSLWDCIPEQDQFELLIIPTYQPFSKFTKSDYISYPGVEKFDDIEEPDPLINNIELKDGSKVEVIIYSAEGTTKLDMYSNGEPVRLIQLKDKSSAIELGNQIFTILDRVCTLGEALFRIDELTDNNSSIFNITYSN